MDYSIVDRAFRTLTAFALGSSGLRLRFDEAKDVFLHVHPRQLKNEEDAANWRTLRDRLGEFHNWPEEELARNAAQLCDICSGAIESEYKLP
jgi:hypothetical protein